MRFRGCVEGYVEGMQYSTPSDMTSPQSTLLTLRHREALDINSQPRVPPPYKIPTRALGPSLPAVTRTGK